MSNKNFAVILAGCGRMDGSEIYETTTMLLAIKQAGCEYQCFAPNIMQAKVFNHKTGDEMLEDRNVLVESARLARCNVKNLKELNLDDYDYIIFPGGVGAVLNWCNYSSKGIDCDVDEEIERTIIKAYSKKIPIGAMCIAPVLIARVLGVQGVELTIGNDEQSARDIESFGAKHINKLATEVHIDHKNKIVSTPAYMLCSSIDEVYQGAVNLVENIMNF